MIVGQLVQVKVQRVAHARNDRIVRQVAALVRNAKRRQPKPRSCDTRERADRSQFSVRVVPVSAIQHLA